MKIVLNALFLVAIIVLVYFMADSINRPVAFRKAWQERRTVVHERLEEIADLQKMYKVLHGDTAYASTFDSLMLSFMQDSFFILRIEGDPFDTTKRADTVAIMFPARDSLTNILARKGKINIEELNAKRNDTTNTAAYLGFAEAEIKKYFDNLRLVPFAKDKKEFFVAVSAVELEGRRAFGRMLPTFEVATTIGTYMPEFPISEYGMYDPNYNPKKIEKVGDLYKPTTSGNW